MHRILKAILIILIVNSWYNQLYAQINDSLKQETILKSWKESSYSRFNMIWLEKNGFDTKNYGYNSVGINAHLENAFKTRETGLKWGMVSALILQRAVSSISGSETSVYASMLLGSAYLSFNKIDKAKNSLSKIESYRKQYMRNYQNKNSEIFSEIFFDSPFRKSQNKWLDRQGFDQEAYNWDNLEINRKLKQAFKARNQSTKVLFLEIPVMYAYALAVLVTSQTNNRTGRHLSKGPFYVAFSVPLIWSLVTSGIAKKKIKEAEFLRKSN